MDQVTLGLNLTMASGSISDTHPSLAADWDTSGTRLRYRP